MIPATRYVQRRRFRQVRCLMWMRTDRRDGIISIQENMECRCRHFLRKQPVLRSRSSAPLHDRFWKETIGHVLENTRFGAATASSLRGCIAYASLHGTPRMRRRKCKQILIVTSEGGNRGSRGDMAGGAEDAFRCEKKLYWQHRPMTRV